MSTVSDQRNTEAGASSSHGSLKIILGPMFSGKSTELIRHIRRYRAIGKTVLVVNHCLNQRYGSTGITTHDARERASTPSPPKDDFATLNLTRLQSLLDDAAPRAALESADIVCIEELQFFEDAQRVVTALVEAHHKHVVAAGLVADYRRQPFGAVLTLLPLADEIVHLRALCAECCDGTLGSFTKRLGAAKETTLVGTADEYRVVCRKHYNATNR